MSPEPLITDTPDGPIASWSAGSGPPLLLVHGGPAISDYMDGLGAETDGWRAVRYQQRGLPPSATNGPFTIERHVADAIAVLDARQIGRTVVLGHSWGGHLALHLALAHPERVAGLVLVDPLGAVGDCGVTELGQQLAARLLPAAQAPYAAVTARLAGPDASDADVLESLALVWPGYYADPPAAPPIPPQLRASLAAYAGTFASAAEHLVGGFADALGDLPVPAVFVLGERSPMPVGQGRQTAALLPRAEVTVVPAAGHMPWYEQPGSIAAALTRIQQLADRLDAP
jgi:pimeloyl-ACP methyl ester carboxylesterase